MVRMFSIDVGKIILEKDNFNGVIDSNKIVSLSNIVFFYDDEGEIFAYGVSNDNQKFVVDICEDYGVADGKTLRDALPVELSEQMNDILLASVDFDDINEEVVDYCVFYPSDADGRDCQYITESDIPDSPGFITVHSIFGQFLFNDSFSESMLKKLKNGALEKRLNINAAEFGEVYSYDTETDMIVILPNQCSSF